MEPIKIKVEGLPEGLTYDPITRVVSGSSSFAGRKTIIITANNDFGEDRKLVVYRSDMGIAVTPPMGWNSWNCWGLNVDQDKVKEAVDAMVKSGLADHGWTYINIDDGWEAAKRTESGELLANSKFPDMKGLADYCHSYGLKLGIYSSPGPTTCGGYPGSYEHEYQDLQTWEEWGIDYIKYDWCGYSDIAPNNSQAELQKPYAYFKKQLDKIDRDIVYSICQYGMGLVWKWGAKVGGNLWRTTGDITDTWNSMAGIGFSQGSYSRYAKHGQWNDPDMLVVGQVGWGQDLHASRLTPDEQYTHVSLWALLAAPLMIGCDMTQLDEFTLSLLTNDEVLEINQDILGKQASPIIHEDGYQIWVKNLSGGSKAVGIFYTADNSPQEAFLWDNEPKFKEVIVKWSDFDISGTPTVRDVWRQQDIRGAGYTYKAKVPYHGVVLLKVK